MHFTDDDFQYAFETTRVLHEPDRRINTFGSTNFEFKLITELMDSVNQVRIREGRIDAAQPQILRPNVDFAFEGFEEVPGGFAQWLRHNVDRFKFLQYGFNFTKSDISESIVHESFDEVSDRVIRQVRSAGNPNTAVIGGVDQAWEVCLLSFTLEMIRKSWDINQFDFRRRGLL